MTSHPIRWKPMMAIAATVLPEGPEWLYEVKWDGYRTIAIKEGGKVTLASRNQKNVTAQYPSVVASVAGLGTEAVLDGEIVALDEEGRPSFQALQHRTTTKHRIVFYAFDLLHERGRDLLKEPLEERRNRLVRIVSGSRVLLSEPLPGSPEQIADAVRGLGLEGVVAKRRHSRYELGRRSDAWVKVRFAKRQEFVIGGYKPADATFDSILVGYYDRKKLWFAGKVRAGFTPYLRAEVFKGIAPIGTSRCPFVNLPNAGKRSRWGEGVTEEEMVQLRWVKPQVVVEVSFTEWTAENNLRHAAFVGLRHDKGPGGVKRES